MSAPRCASAVADRAGPDAGRAGADDHRPEHRSGGVVRRTDLPGHRHADLRGEGPGRHQPDRAAAADPRGGRRSHPARQATAEFGGLDHRRELRRQPRPRHADHPLRSVGGAGDRGQADPQGRRLREHERAIRAADRARSSGPRRSLARRRPQVHPARGVEGAGERLQPGRGRRLRRRRSHVRIPPREGAAVPHARRREPGSSASRRVEAGRHGGGEPAHGRADGLRRTDIAHRLQDRRAQPPAGELLRVDRLRLLGLPPARRPPRRDERRDHELAVSRGRHALGSHAAGRQRSRRDSRAPAARFRSRRRSRKSRSAPSRSGTSC